jgi:RNA polymerase sigma factor (sigma-70 family)
MKIEKDKESGFRLPAEATFYQEAQAGCQESLNGLMAEHEGLVHYAVNRQELYGIGYEEAVQAGRLGLWRAILGYDAQRGTQFSTYAYLAIIRQVWAEVRGHLASQGRQVARAMLGLYFYETGADPARLWEKEEAVQSVLGLVGRLPGAQGEVIRRRYGLAGGVPQTQAEIACQLGVTQQRISQLERAALVWLGQPAHSQALRSLLRRHHQIQYELADRQAQAWLQRRGGRHGHA